LLLTQTTPSEATRMSSRSAISAMPTLNWLRTFCVIERTTCRLSLSEVVPSRWSPRRATPTVMAIVGNLSARRSRHQEAGAGGGGILQRPGPGDATRCRDGVGRGVELGNLVHPDPETLALLGIREAGDDRLGSIRVMIERSHLGPERAVVSEHRVE